MIRTLPFFQSATFDPEATKVMGDVFDEAIQSLDKLARPRMVQEAIAKKIIEAVQDGERDPERIYSGCWLCCH
jgi:hypothetical protein